MKDSKATIKATHQGVLEISNIKIPCFVLEDGRRMISQRGLQRGIGMSLSGGMAGERRIVTLIDGFGEKGLNTTNLSEQIMNPVIFQPLRGGPEREIAGRNQGEKKYFLTNYF
jgi:hypothetical protein